MLSFWKVETGRLTLRPVSPGDLDELQALKGDPRAFALILGGVRTPQRAAEELAEDMAAWSRDGFGMWTVRVTGTGAFAGITGLMHRPDNRGPALRFALSPAARGRGYASEAAGAALRFAHQRAGLRRVIAVARETNIASRQVLGSIGMRVSETFEQQGHTMLLFESVQDAPPV